jgi:hypothetical protein
MRHQFFDRIPDRDAAYRFRPVITSATPTQQPTRQENTRPTQTSGRIIIRLQPSSQLAPPRTQAAIAGTARISPQVPTSTAAIQGRTEFTHGDDELAILLQHPVWSALHNSTEPSTTGDTENVDYRRLMRLLRTAHADMHFRRDELRYTSGLMEGWRRVEDLESEPSWRRLEDLYELSQSLGFFGRNTVEPLQRPSEEQLTRHSLSKSTIERLVATPRPFQCPICFEAVSNPVIFVPCGHVLCESCLDGMRRIARRERCRMRCHFCRARLGPYTNWESLRHVYGIEE